MMKRMLRGLDAGAFRTLSAAACANVLTHPAYSRAGTLLLYSALPFEADPSVVARQAVHDGKRVAYPYCEEGPERRLAALEPFTEEDWEEGTFGIRTPVPGRSRMVPREEIDLVLVPGLAFDAQGGRLGRGAGYYDRYLADSPAFFMGFCLDMQLMERVPTDAHDVRMDAVLTNSACYDCKY